MDAIVYCVPFGAQHPQLFFCVSKTLTNGEQRLGLRSVCFLEPKVSVNEILIEYSHSAPKITLVYADLEKRLSRVVGRK